MYSRRGSRGYLSGFGAITAASVTSTGAVKATQFRATADGTTSSFAFTWDADENIGLRRNGADTFTVGIGANQPLLINQFTATFGESAQFSGGTYYTNYQVPTAISGTVHDYAPSGWNASRSGIKQDISAACTLTGLAAASNGVRQILQNVTTTAGRNLTIQHDNGADSTATNRFYCPNLANYVLAPGEGVVIEYDTTLSSGRWHVIGTV
jgi:hypothetical protein